MFWYTIISFSAPKEWSLSASLIHVSGCPSACVIVAASPSVSIHLDVCIETFSFNQKINVFNTKFIIFNMQTRQRYSSHGSSPCGAKMRSSSVMVAQIIIFQSFFNHFSIIFSIIFQWKNLHSRSILKESSLSIEESSFS